ncbi:MAG: hypothetical protein RL885_04925 [Planctomycetota bacterium]
MELPTTSPALELPVGTRDKLRTYQRSVWRIKLLEGLLRALFALTVSYLLVLGLDRLGETPGWLRLTILLGGASGLGLFLPLQWHRWIWGTRRLEQLARLLKHHSPRLSDQLLGVIELVQNRVEQQRSEALCRAALAQVDEEVMRHDFDGAVPSPRHRRWAAFAAVPLLLIVTAMATIPEASQNALLRWLLPWQTIERYTFARVEELPEERVVPFAEPFEVIVDLSSDTRWSPDLATASYDGQAEIEAERQGERYVLSVPPQKKAGLLEIAIGDVREAIEIVPTTRPELTRITAQVTLPDYLLQPGLHERDLRGGSVTIVEGSQVTLAASASRELAEATLDGRPQTIEGDRIVTDRESVSETVMHELAWRDRFGLEAREPFTLEIRGVEDEAPTLLIQELSNESVLLVDDVLAFQVQAHDDFGVREIGLAWAGVADRFENPEPAEGEKILAAGGPTNEDLKADAAFCARTDGVSPQVLKLRVWAVDYHPERERIYSPPFTVIVMSAEDHAIWLTRQLGEWQRRSLEVYEREQQLYQGNRELRSLPADQIDLPENRLRIETQARAEAANGRRLDTLTQVGEQLVQEAARNDQFNATNLEDLAAAVQSLKDLAKNRMPSVSDLLNEAADAQTLAKAGEPSEAKPSEGSSKSPPSVDSGQKQKPGSGKPSDSKPSEVPSISDPESGFASAEDDPEGEEDEKPKSSSPGKLGLPGTTLQGKPQPGNQPEEEAGDPLDEALKEQKDLLAEFARVSDELKRILGELEGSTFVKRLKAASRKQIEVARDVNRNLLAAFGQPIEKEKKDEPAKPVFGVIEEPVEGAVAGIEEPVEGAVAEAEEPAPGDAEPWRALLSDRELHQSRLVAVIQEDLEAYFNRTQEGKFETVLSEMIDVGVVDGLFDMSDDVKTGFDGQTIAQAEYWGDALDRWAEQLVGPG